MMTTYALHIDGHAKSGVPNPNFSISDHFLYFFLFSVSSFSFSLIIFLFLCHKLCFSLSYSNTHSLLFLLFISISPSLELILPFFLYLCYLSFLFFSCWSCQINGLAEANAKLMWSPTTEKCFFPNVCQSHQSHGGASFS